ncbi:MAG: REP-associated tyrosine transposase [Planctomycetota bacterium]
MPSYRRARIPGGSFFFTLVTADRRPILCDGNRVACIREAIRVTQQERPFVLDAAIILPDHLHFIWTLPPGDDDFPTRWRLIKSRCTRAFRSTGLWERPVSPSRKRHGDRGIWQRRYWEHVVRDEHQFERLVDYIHYNPVKHGLAHCPHEWDYTSFHRYVARRIYDASWACQCTSDRPPLDFTDVESIVGEPE